MGYASFPCYPECKAHLTAHPQKFGNFLTPLLGSKESKDDKGAVDFGDKDVTEDAKVAQAKQSLGLAIEDDGDAARTYPTFWTSSCLLWVGLRD